MSEIKELAFRKGVSKPHFYKIEYFGRTSYLLGTYHWGVSMDEFPAEVRERAEAAEKLIVELKPTAYDLQQSERCESNMDDCLIRLNRNAAGRKMRKKYREALYPFLSEYALKRMKSYLDLDSAYLAWPALITEGGSMEMDLIRSAHNNGQDIIGLETIRERLNNIDRAIFNGQTRLRNTKLIDLAKDVYNGDLSWYEDKAQSLSDYRAGKIETEYLDMLSMTYRNEAWLSRLLEELKTSETYIAVGYLHLYGNKGLLKLLRERNLRIERVDFE